MKSLKEYIAKLRPSGGTGGHPQERGFRVSRNTTIIGGVVMLCCLFAAVVVLDSYLFYTSVIETRELIIPISSTRRSLTERDIQDVVLLLGERKNKFDALLETFPVPVSTTSSQSSGD